VKQDGAATISWPLLLAVAITSCVAGYGLRLYTATEEARQAQPQHPDLAEFKPQIADAVRRWSVKSGETEQRVRKEYTPRAMFIPTRNQGQGMLCLEVSLRPGNLGGSPVYCYLEDFFKPNERTKLVAEYSDVE
jgi:hypothetical protein